PSEQAVKIALRTQQIIAHESGAANTIDPLGGSYYVEWLTNKMEEESEKYFNKIDELGGVIPAIKDNFFQMEIARASYQYQKEIENNDLNIVGVNMQRSGSCRPAIDILKIDEKVSEEQVKRLQAVKDKRDDAKVKETLANVRKVAEGSENLMYPILEAVKAYASVGEIIAVLKEVFGIYREDAVF
ncbi:MAG: methylmalonyl-CoA mutase family protein, partial [Promethearchaeota archaeon]